MQTIFQARDILLPLFQQGQKFLQLLSSNCRLNLGHTIIKPKHIDNIRLAHTLYNRFCMISDETHSFSKFIIVSNNDSPFSGMNMFVIIQ